MDAQVTAAVLSRLTGLKAGWWAQVHLDGCMAAAHALANAGPVPAGQPQPLPVWPTWKDFMEEIERFFLPGNNAKWACAQLLHLRQGPRQWIDDFLAQFEVLKNQSGCIDQYARDLLERAFQRKVLEQIYLQNMNRETYIQLAASAHEMGRAQELFLINTQGQGSAWYYQGQNYSPSSASASGTPMDIGAADAQLQQRGKGPQCYNCQLFGHIACECTKPCRPCCEQQQAWAVQAQLEDDVCRDAGVLLRFKRLESEDKSGTLALKSSLDTAVRILDYRLSRATSSAAAIFKYQVTLLHAKVSKTHKKVLSVVSPVSVSPNRFTTLWIDSMDCDSDYTVPSKGVPAKGSAPEVKLSVLNSQMNKNNFSRPLASKEPESPAGNLEVSLDLWRSFTMECEVMVPVCIRGPLNTIEVDTLLDSGTTGCFIDKSQALD